MYNTLYSFNGKLYDWSPHLKEEFKDNLIRKGEPLTCEYRRLSICSSKFDRFFKSEIMLVNFIKHNSGKEEALESITYYDDDATISRIAGKRYYKEGPFDASEYGHPVCFYTPGYKGSSINITTKFWELNDSKTIKKLANFITSSLQLGSTASSYFTIASSVFNISSNIMIGFVQHRDLLPNHNIEFRLDSSIHPLLKGKYVCFPNITLTEKYKVIEKYILIDNMLVYKNVKNDGDTEYIEYDKSYFILRVDNDERKELSSFDFTASSADLIKKLKGNQDDFPMDDLLELQKVAYNMKIEDDIHDDYDTYLKSNKDEDKLNMLKASYKQLESIGKKEFDKFNKNFPEIKELFLK